MIHMNNSVHEIESLAGVGKKIKQAIKLYLKTGSIPEAKRIETDVKFHTMSKFLKVWGEQIKTCVHE
jgi:DNA polymerase/3'-5' exonuclease PolX